MPNKLHAVSKRFSVPIFQFHARLSYGSANDFGQRISELDEPTIGMEDMQGDRVRESWTVDTTMGMIYFNAKELSLLEFFFLLILSLQKNLLELIIDR